jgi:P4 family phage/plasmid primase-like protien
MAGDIPDMAMSNTATFKGLTGDDRIRAEEKGKPAYEFWNRAKLLFSANQLPPTKDKSTGYMRRWILVDFLRPMVTNPNPRLAAELLAEKSGIFNWMLIGAKRLNEKGFTYTSDPEEMAKRYIERSEPVTLFLEECCKEDFDSFESVKSMHAVYNAWMKVNHKKKMSSREFLNAMRNQSKCPVEYLRKTLEVERDAYGHVTYEYKPWGFDGIKLIKTTDNFQKLSTDH